MGRLPLPILRRSLCYTRSLGPYSCGKLASRRQDRLPGRPGRTWVPTAAPSPSTSEKAVPAASAAATRATPAEGPVTGRGRVRETQRC